VISMNGLALIAVIVLLALVVTLFTFFQAYATSRLESKKRPSPFRDPAPAPSRYTTVSKGKSPEEPTDTGTYAVVLGSYEQLEPDLFGSILAGALGIRSYDAIAAARDARGVLAERGASEAAAERLVEGLAGQGIEAFMIPATRILRAGKPTQVRLIKPEDDGIHVTLGYSAQARVLPYESLVLASGGWITEVRNRPTRHRRTRKRRGIGLMTAVGGAMFGVVGAKIGHEADKAVKEAEKVRARVKASTASTDVGVADLFVREPDGSFLHLRLRNRDLYYPQILGEEATSDFQVNFSQVLCRILNRAAGASFNPGLEVMIDSSAEVDPSEAQFGSEKEFTAFTRWLLQVTEIADLVPEEGDLTGTPFELIDEVPSDPAPEGRRLGGQA
jgi:hypothetical protein